MKKDTILILISIILLILIYNNYKEKMELSPKLTNDDKINLKVGQEKMTTMLSEFDRICKKYNLKYFAIGGTLLGAIRHKGWIPYDGDIDLMINRDDYEIFRNVASKELPPHLWLQDHKIDKRHPFTEYWCIAKVRDLNSCYIDKGHEHHNGLMLDIFQYKENKNGKIKPSVGKLNGIKFDDIYPIKYVDFEDIKIPIPNNYKLFLTKEYGKNWMKILPVSKRFPHEGRFDPYNTCKFHYKMYPKLYNY